MGCNLLKNLIALGIYTINIHIPILYVHNFIFWITLHYIAGIAVHVEICSSKTNERTKKKQKLQKQKKVRHQYGKKINPNGNAISFLYSSNTQFIFWVSYQWI